MSLAEIIILSVGLAMDAFAVSVGKGLSMQGTIKKVQAFWIAAFFGLFQALMPLLGYYAGRRFAGGIGSVDHWIAFVLLALIGVHMIKEGLSKEDENSCQDEFSFRELFFLAIATSIDALAVGVTFSFLNVNLFQAVMVIGIVTFLISAAGVVIGHCFGDKFQEKAEISGGLILVIMGLKILIQHLFF